MKRILSLVVLSIMLITLSGCSLFSLDNDNSIEDTGLTQEEYDDLYAKLYSEVYASILEEDMTKFDYEVTFSVTDLETAIQSVYNESKDSVLGVNNMYNGSIQSTGSAVLYKRDNTTYYAVTNYHVVEDNSNVTVEFSDGETVDATVVGYDSKTDLAVLSFTYNTALDVLSFSDNTETDIGDFALAIGNPEGPELYGSLSFGIVSGIDRYIDTDSDGYTDLYTSFIQTDAAINPGNSGGALLNLSGEIIGINTIKYIGEDVDNIGFAISSNTVSSVVAEIEANGVVVRPVLGLQFIEVGDIKVSDNITLPTGITEGLYVTGIVDGSSLSGSGIQVGDVIIGFDGNTVVSAGDVTVSLYQHDVGDIVAVVFVHENVTSSTTVNITLQGS